MIIENSYIELLNMIQNDFPIESRPFLALTKKLDMTEEEIIESVKKLKEQGYVRRLGGVFDSKKLGYRGILCAMEVTKDRIEEVAQIVNDYQCVTHNYLRNHKFNMWFTMIVPSSSSLQDRLQEIKFKAGINNILVLSSINTYKINVNFNLEGA